MGCDSFIIGDFNIDLKQKCAKTRKLVNLFENYGFSELIRDSTRKDPVSGRESALDHVWTNSKHLSSFGKIAGVSDHEGIFVTFGTEKENQKIEKITIRNFKNFNEKNFNDELKSKLEKLNDNLNAQANVEFMCLPCLRLMSKHI